MASSGQRKRRLRGDGKWLGSGAIIALVGLLLAPTVMPAGAQATEPLPDLEACRQLKRRIADLETRRRNGGSSVQMDRWKREGRAAKAAFRAGRCQRFAYRLE